jgi:hypothetical protein
MYADKIHYKAQEIRRAISADRAYLALSAELDRADTPGLYESTLIALGERAEEITLELLQPLEHDERCDVMRRINVLDAILTGGLLQ